MAPTAASGAAPPKASNRHLGLLGVLAFAALGFTVYASVGADPRDAVSSDQRGDRQFTTTPASFPTPLSRAGDSAVAPQQGAHEPSHQASAPQRESAANGGTEPNKGRNRAADSKACTLASDPRVPPSVQTLCSVTTRRVQAQLTAFFHGELDPLRVFVEDADVRPMQGGPCEKLFNRAFNKREAHDNPYASKFAAELLIPIAMQHTAYSVKDPEEANFFLAASCVMGQGQQGQHTVVAADLVRERYGTYWERNGGRDHGFVLTADHGPCLLFRERMGSQNDFFKYKRKRWQTDAIKGATLLVNEGSLHGGCYDPTKDIVVPTSVVHNPEPLRCARDGDAGEGPPVQHLAFLGGLSSSTLRLHIRNHYAEDADFFTPEGRIEHSEYLCHMAASAFCLCPRGQAAWSPRLEESIYAGCVPVIIADDYEPPLAHVLDYSAFAVRVLQDDVPQLKAILQAVSAERLQQLRRNVRAVRGVFRYLGYASTPPEGSGDSDSEARAAHGNDVTPLIAFELWRQVNSVRNVTSHQVWSPRDKVGFDVFPASTLAHGGPAEKKEAARR